jgi:hypothetical protein
MAYVARCEDSVKVQVDYMDPEVIWVPGLLAYIENYNGQF